MRQNTQWVSSLVLVTVFSFGVLLVSPAFAHTVAVDQRAPCFPTLISRPPLCEIFATSPAGKETAVVKLIGEYFMEDKALTPFGDVKGEITTRMGDVDGDGLLDYIFASGSNVDAQIAVASIGGTIEKTFIPFGFKTKSGLSMALPNINGDGDKEIFVAARQGAPIFAMYNYNAFTKNYDLMVSGSAYDQSYRGGIAAEAGDIDGDGKDDVVVAPRSGSGAIRFYGFDNATLKFKGDVTPFDGSVSGGYRIRVGNVIGDGKAEIVVTPRSGANPVVEVYGWDGTALSKLTSFSAYGDTATKSFTSGVQIALGDIAGDTHKEIVTVPWQRPGPVRLWQSGFGDIFRPIASASLFSPSVRGMNLLVRDVNPDRASAYSQHHDEVVVAPRGGESPTLHILRYYGNFKLGSRFSNFEETGSPTHFHPDFRGEIQLEGSD